MKISGTFIGTAGVYYVMSELSRRNFHAAATHGNAPNFDILVCTRLGESALAIQVKSSRYATRWRGRGNDRKPDSLDFPFSYEAGKISLASVLFAFVDFGVEEGRNPHIYFVPSTETSDWCSAWIGSFRGKMVRYKRPLSEMEPYKDNWSYLEPYRDHSAADETLPNVDENEDSAPVFNPN